MSKFCAINGGTLEIKFSAPVNKDIIDNSDQLAVGANVIELGSNDLDGNKAELSEDGKTLTVYSDLTTPVAFNGSYVLKIAGDIIEGKTEGTWVPAYTETVTFNDTTRPTIKNVETVSKYVFDVNLSEPIDGSAITPTAKYTDNSGDVTVTTQAVRNNNKTIRVTLDPATKANKEITLLFPSLTDIKGNVQVPTTVKVTVSDADQTEPTLVSAKALSNKKIEFTFSKGLSTVTTANIKYNGTALGGSDTAGLKIGDNKTVVVTLNTANTLAVAPFEFAAGAVTGLNNVDNKAFTQTVNFKEDKTGPVLEKQKVVSGSPNELHLTFNEEVTKVGSSALNFKYVDEFGVSKQIVVPTTKVSVNATDNKVVEIDLEDSTPDALPANVEYTVEFAKGYFVDGFNNDSAKFDVTFNNSGSSTTSKLKLAAGTPITEKASTPGVIEVKFADAVNANEAKNKANYTVEGATVEKVTLIANTPGSGATVEVKLTDGSVKVDGNYNVSVKGISGFNTNVLKMTPVTENISLTENVRPEVKKAEVVSFDGTVGSEETVVKLTFSEKVKSALDGTSGDENKLYKLYIDGK